MNLGSSVNSASYDYNSEISWDGSRIVFTSDINGVDQIYEASIIREPFDLTGDGTLDIGDLDLLQAAVKAGTIDTDFDVNGDGTVNPADVQAFVTRPDILNTWVGDADLNGEFNSADFVTVFQAGQYEDTVAGNSTWATGDWNTDGDFNSSDFVMAFQGGGYEQGPRPAVNAVPEPGMVGSLWVGLFAIAYHRRRRCVDRRQPKHRSSVC